MLWRQFQFEKDIKWSGTEWSSLGSCQRSPSGSDRNLPVTQICVKFSNLFLVLTSFPFGLQFKTEFYSEHLICLIFRAVSDFIGSWAIAAQTGSCLRGPLRAVLVVFIIWDSFRLISQRLERVQEERLSCDATSASEVYFGRHSRLVDVLGL